MTTMTQLAAEIERLRSLLLRQYLADVALYGMPHDCTKNEHLAAMAEHDAVHLLLEEEFKTDGKPT